MSTVGLAFLARGGHTGEIPTASITLELQTRNAPTSTRCALSFCKLLTTKSRMDTRAHSRVTLIRVTLIRVTHNRVTLIKPSTLSPLIKSHKYKSKQLSQSTNTCLVEMDKNKRIIMNNIITHLRLSLKTRTSI